MRRVLFDENMPRKLRREMPEFAVRTVQEEGWAGFKNSELLRRASGTFDVLLTVDQQLRHQQNLRQSQIGIAAREHGVPQIDLIAADIPPSRPLGRAKDFCPRSSPHFVGAAWARASCRQDCSSTISAEKESFDAVRS